MRWINEFEMATSVDDLKKLRSITGKHFPNFETLDAKAASSLKKVIQNSHFRKMGSIQRSNKPQKDDRFFRDRQIAFGINEHIRMMGTPVAIL